MVERAETTEELNAILTGLEQGAKNRGLVVYPQVSNTTAIVLDWNDDGERFLDIAATVGVRILYLDKECYDPVLEIREAMEEEGFESPLTEEENGDPADEA